MRICKVEGCGLKHYAKGYCNKHYNQVRKRGEVYRSTHDRNIIREENSIFIMELYNNKGEIIAETKFDSIYIEEIKKHKWFLSSDGYAKSKISDKYYNLSNFLMGDFGQKYMFDHRNRDRLNNLSENLRKVTYSQNAINRSISSSNTSGKTGISWRKDKNKYYAAIWINRNKKHLGCFTNIQDAISARRQGEIKYFGEYSPNVEAQYENKND